MKVTELANDLGAVGLDDGEAMVYLRLLQTGPAKVSQLSAYVEMSRSTLYRILDGLADVGYVTKSLERPTIYTPEEPENVFEIGSRDLRRRLDHLESVKERVIEPLQSIAHAENGQDEPHHWKRLEGSARIYEVIHNCAQSAEMSIEIVSNHQLCTRTWLPIVEKAWRILSNRAEDGVDVRLLLGYEDPIDHVPEGITTDPLEIRTFDEPDTLHFLLFDREEIVLVLRPREGSISQQEEVAVWTDAPGLLATHRALFQNRWPQATVLAEA